MTCMSITAFLLFMSRVDVDVETRSGGILIVHADRRSITYVVRDDRICYGGAKI